LSLAKACSIGFGSGEHVGRKEQLGAGGADEPADRFALVTAEVIHDHDVAGAQRRDQDLFDIDLEGLAVDRPSSSHGAASAKTVMVSALLATS
jgi:hypothetical protein